MYEPTVTGRVTVTDIDMPFWSMVRFMLKWAIAAIPAMIILGVVGMILGVLLTVVLSLLGGGFGLPR